MDIGGAGRFCLPRCYAGSLPRVVNILACWRLTNYEFLFYIDI